MAVHPAHTHISFQALLPGDGCDPPAKTSAPPADAAGVECTPKETAPEEQGAAKCGEQDPPADPFDHAARSPKVHNSGPKVSTTYKSPKSSARGTEVSKRE